MREILFRGLHRRKGEIIRLDGTPAESRWVYGGVCQFSEERAIIYQTEPEITKFSVYAETVGQFTGFYDSTKWESLPESKQKEWLESHTADEWKGRKIFEGDIITFDDCWGEQHKGVVYWSSGSYNVDCSKSVNEEDEVFFRLFTAYACGAEIIGNIYDNPELLKQEGRQ